MPFLLIETCTERGVVAYGDQSNCLFAKELPFGLTQSQALMPYLAEALQPFGSPPAIKAIGVGIGPGSYTGIRLGVAVAQALAYSWKVPLIGFSSLEGFVPSQASPSFAAILDARIGGVYVKRTLNSSNGENPRVLALEEVGQYLKDVTHLVTPVAKSLQTKLSLHYPDGSWIWEEKAPSIPLLLQKIEQRYQQQQGVIPPAHLNLLYLRQTEAEREKAHRLAK